MALHLVAETDLTPQERWSRIMQAAQQAQVAKVLAEAAGEDGSIYLWCEYGMLCSSALRLLTEAGSVPMRLAIDLALADAPDGAVPAAWTGLIAGYKQAFDVRAVMRNRKVPQDMRDEAARAYCAATDAMVDAMDLLSGDQTLDRIALLMSRGVAA
jgi:rhodanese-related sulfurtransferase